MRLDAWRRLLGSWGRHALAGGLVAASGIYEAVSGARSAAREWGLLRPNRLRVPVISVGNVTWGGNGKTPMAERLARLCLEEGARPLIINPAYGGDDEVRMLRRNLGGCGAVVLGGRDRAAVAQEGAQAGGGGGGAPGVVILDDGLQQQSLESDLHVLMVNALQPWGNGLRVPRGPLRQDPASALARADVVVLHHGDLVPVEDLSELRGAVAAACRPSALVMSTSFVPTRIYPVGAEPGMEAVGGGMWWTAQEEGDGAAGGRRFGALGGLYGCGDGEAPVGRGQRAAVLSRELAAGAAGAGSTARKGDDSWPSWGGGSGESRGGGGSRPLEGRQVLGVCGVGCAAAFEGSLRGLGAVDVRLAAHPDHHHFTRGDLEQAAGAVWLAGEGGGGQPLLATTEKDVARSGGLLQEVLGPLGCVVVGGEVRPWGRGGGAADRSLRALVARLVGPVPSHAELM